MIQSAALENQRTKFAQLAASQQKAIEQLQNAHKETSAKIDGLATRLDQIMALLGKTIANAPTTSTTS